MVAPGSGAGQRFQLCDWSIAGAATWFGGVWQLCHRADLHADTGGVQGLDFHSNDERGASRAGPGSAAHHASRVFRLCDRGAAADVLAERGIMIAQLAGEVAAILYLVWLRYSSDPPPAGTRGAVPAVAGRWENAARAAPGEQPCAQGSAEYVFPVPVDREDVPASLGRRVAGIGPQRFRPAFAEGRGVGASTCRAWSKWCPAPAANGWAASRQRPGRKPK